MRLDIRPLLVLYLVFSNPWSYAQTLGPTIVHNATLALEQSRYQELIQHWFLYQSLQESEQSQIGEQRMLSLVWAAVDRLALCPESLPVDEPGQVLWPLVLFNYLARYNQSPKGTEQEDMDSLRSFTQGQRLRRVAFDEVLSSAEILSLRPHRDVCTFIESLVPEFTFPFQARLVRLPIRTRAEAMLSLLRKVEDQTQLSSGREWLQIRRLGLQLYLSERGDTIDPASEPLIRFLIKADRRFHKLLEPDLRLYLFQLGERIKPEDQAEHRYILLQWLDLAIEIEDAQLLDQVVFAIVQFAPHDQLHIWRGDRGARLLLLAEKGVFHEGGSVAVARALEANDQKQILEALGLLARAHQLAPLSRSEQVDELAEAWLRHLLLQHRFDRRLLDFLERTLEKTLLKKMMQDIIWRSALMGEPQVLQLKAYDTYLSQRLRGYYPYLMDLAQRRLELFRQRFIRGLQEEPRQALSFAIDLAEQAKLEDFRIIETLFPALRSVQRAMEEAQSKKLVRGGSIRSALELYDSLLQNSKDSTEAQSDRLLGQPVPIALGALRIPPSRLIPWTFPPKPQVSINVFQGLPFHLTHEHDHTHYPVLLWHLGPP